MRAAHGGYKGIVNILLTAKTPASTRVTNKVGTNREYENSTLTTRTIFITLYCSSLILIIFSFSSSGKRLYTMLVPVDIV